MSKIDENNNLENLFHINQKEYLKFSDALIKQINYTPINLIQAFVLLPFHIPFANDLSLTLPIDQCTTITFHFTDLNSTDRYSAGILDIKSSEIIQQKSKVEMAVFSAKSIDESNINNELNCAYDLMIKNLNLIIISYLIVTKDVSCYQITKEMLAPICMMQIINVIQWQKLWSGIFLTHKNVEFVKKALNETEVFKIFQQAHNIKNNFNPFVLSEELLLNSIRNFNEGHYKEAVFYIQSSIETFLKTLLVKLLEIEQLTELAIDQKLEKPNFMGMVKKEFNTRLGGIWDINNINSEIGKWHNYTYKLRNKIVHSGYMPNFDETNTAISFGINFINYIKDLIKKNKNPDLLKYFIF